MYDFESLVLLEEENFYVKKHIEIYCLQVRLHSLCF